MAGDCAELHLWHDWKPEGRGAASSRRVSERGGECADVRVVATQRVFVDAADVPLQWLDIYLGCDTRGWHACVPASRGAGADLCGDRRAWRDAHVRSAGGVEHVDPCARGGATDVFTDRTDCHGRRRATEHGDRSDGGNGVCGDASLRADGELWAIHGVHVAAGAG